MIACSRRGMLGLAALSLSPQALHALAPASLRLALVVGNDRYPEAPLRNSVNDARAMARVLGQSGFEVMQLHDAPLAELREAVRSTSERLRPGGVALFFYSGHAVQLGWRNYLVPVDAKLQRGDDVPRLAFDLQQVLQAFEAGGARINIVVLDACRDNPFGELVSTKGLAPMDAAPGTLLAYATAPGNVASDGDARSGNGLYTSFLVREIERGPAPIEDVFKRVRLQVRQSSRGRQVPWESTSLEEDFQFTRVDMPSTATRPRSREQVFRLDKEGWDRIKDGGDAAALYRFLEASPSGPIAELAQARLDQLEAPTLQQQPDRAGVVQPLVARRFMPGDEYELVSRASEGGPVQARQRIRVVRADIQVAEFDQGYRVTQAGAIIRTIAGATLDPYQQWIPAGEYQLGRKWWTRSTMRLADGRTMWVEMDGRVVARETIEVEAGRFDTWRMQMVQTAEDGTRLEVAYWGQPDWGVAVKQIRIETDSQGRERLQVLEVARRTRVCHRFEDAATPACRA